jgi:serine/threonine protein kinase
VTSSQLTVSTLKTKANIVIQAGGWWKLTDFGISTAGTSRTLQVTENGRGTERYCAPEILLSQSSTPSYTNKVDIWGLGTILYELCTLRTAFTSAYQVIQYFSTGTSSPTVLESDLDLTLAIDESSYLQSYLERVNSLLPAGILHTPSLSQTMLPVAFLNRQIAWFLATDPKRRPSTDQADLLSTVYSIEDNFARNVQVNLHYPSDLIYETTDD